MLALDFDMYLIDEGMPASTDVEFNRKAGTSFGNGCARRRW